MPRLSSTRVEPNVPTPETPPCTSLIRTGHNPTSSLDAMTTSHIDRSPAMCLTHDRCQSNFTQSLRSSCPNRSQGRPSPTSLEYLRCHRPSDPTIQTRLLLLLRIDAEPGLAPTHANGCVHAFHTSHIPRFCASYKPTEFPSSVISMLSSARIAER